MDKERKLLSHIDQVRKLTANQRLRNSLFMFTTLLITITVALLYLEGVFWFGTTIRWSILIGALLASAISIGVVLMIHNRIKRGQMSGSSDEELAWIIGEDNPSIKDKLLNAIQIGAGSDKSNFSQELIDSSIKHVEKEIANTDLSKSVENKNRSKRNKTLLTVALIAVSLLLISPAQLKNAASRLVLPSENFNPALPFSVEVSPKNTEIVKGDTLNFSATVSGNQLPATMIFETESQGIISANILMPDSSGIFRFAYESIKENFSYRFKAKDPKFLKSWVRYESDKYKVSVLNRPSVRRMNIKLEFPGYSKLENKVFEGNMGEIVALRGTKATFSIESNKLLSSAEISFSTGENISLKTESRSAVGHFVIDNSGSFHLSLHDTQGIENINPVEFAFIAMRDEFPVISLLEQPENFDLDASMAIPMRIRIDDDFGITEVAIALRVISEYGEKSDSSFQFINIDLPPIRTGSLELGRYLDLSPFEIAPSDIIEYYGIVYDNDTYSGPKLSRSRLYYARFPSLAELYKRIEEDTRTADNSAEETLKEAKELREAIEELTEEFKKDPELDWAKRQKIEETIRKQEEIEKSLESITDKLDEIIEEAEKNQLFTEESLQMYMELQNLFQDLASSELFEAMEKMREAMISLNEDDMAKALQEFNLSQEQFTRELERTLEIFRRVQAEQKMDEIVKRMTELAEEQKRIAEETNKLSEENKNELKSLAEREERAKDELANISEEMKELENITEPFPEMPTSKIAELQEEMESGDLPNSLQQSEQAMMDSDLSSSKEKSDQASGELSEMLSKLDSLKQEMRKKQLQEVLAGFQKITRKALQISKIQEELTLEGEGLKSNSPNLAQIAAKQEEQRRDLSSLVEDLVELSKKTFGISPAIARSIGKTSGAMSEAVKKLSERNARQGSAAQSEALGGLNQTILSLRGAMSQLSASGSGTGFEQYLQQMQQMANAQGGINSETLNMMPGMKPGGSRSSQSMRNLAARQEQIRRSLEKMMKEMAGKNEGVGRLDGIANEMNEVIKDLKNRRLSRKTIQRQQRILSRMLDSQKSMREREKSRKRKSKSGIDIARYGPSGLPQNRGERGELLNRELINALREGYSMDYQELIRKYYDSLRSNQSKNSQALLPVESN